MPHMRTEENGHWIEFCEYAEENGISLEHHEDWYIWWECWNAALDAADQEMLNLLPNRGN